ncbi:hypothetical protein HY213_00975 [Candidatus Peregrinibacteria bacterium]|nr:hypothetical protein [Candidatus Peregrinibacteria bacterium]
MNHELQAVVQLVEAEFEPWELPHLILNALQSKNAVSMEELVRIARDGLSCPCKGSQYQMDRPQRCFIVESRGNGTLCPRQNSGYILAWNDQGNALSWRQDRSSVLELTRSSVLAVLR